MKIHISIFYKTNWGQNVCIKTSFCQKICLKTKDGLTWFADLDIIEKEFNYHYFVEENNATIHSEPSFCHSIELSSSNSHTTIQDEWFDATYSKVFSSSAFTKCFLPIVDEKKSSQHKIYVSALPPQAGKWALCSNIIDNWQKPILLKHIRACEWVFNVPSFVEQFEYKIVLVKKRHIIWEEGENRSFHINHNLSTIQHICPRLNYALWKGAGIVIPVFSLRSEQSWGVGDFGDLEKLVKWSAKCAIKLIQILPINDTDSTHTWRDSYPYSGISVFALHPLYTNCNALGSPQLRHKFEHERKLLNKKKFMDYEASYNCKIRFLKELYKEERLNIIKSDSYQDFITRNAYWLHPYAAFKYLCNKYQSPHYDTWEKIWQNYDKEKFDEYTKDSPAVQDEITFYYFIQYILHQQLLQVKERAQQLHMVLKGDLPIGVSKYSVETWTNPTLFYTYSQAGAPPDAFAIKGQNWGFPTYNWPEMEKDQYEWWKKRLQHMNQYFDAFRIDHVLGFFRIWEIPYQQIEGILGSFRPACPYTVSEIKNFGFHFDPTCHTNATLYPTYVKQHPELIPYLTQIGQYYQLKEDVSTQRKVYENIKSETLRNELLNCVTEVLFIRDSQNANLYHPRIDGQRTMQFANLTQSQQEAYNQLYNNFFYYRHNDFWGKEAMKKLPAITQASRMLACAEDLGMIPDCVQPTLNELEILTLEIQRMPKQYGIPIANTQQYPYLSVCSIDTHDMAPLRLWWKENQTAAQYIWKSILKQDTQAPPQINPQIAKAIICDHLNSPSMLCIISMQDYLALFSKLKTISPEEEQINIPANPHHYWKYRMPINIEELENTPYYASIIASLILQSNR